MSERDFSMDNGSEMPKAGPEQTPQAPLPEGPLPAPVEGGTRPPEGSSGRALTHGPERPDSSVPDSEKKEGDPLSVDADGGTSEEKKTTSELDPLGLRKQQHEDYVANLPEEEKEKYTNAVEKMKPTEEESVTPEKAADLIDLAQVWKDKGGDPVMMLTEAGHEPEEAEALVGLSDISKEVAAEMNLSPEERKEHLQDMGKLRSKDASPEELKAILDKWNKKGKEKGIDELMNYGAMESLLRSAGRTPEEINTVLGEAPEEDPEKKEKDPSVLSEEDDESLKKLKELATNPAGAKKEDIDAAITGGQGLLSKIMEKRNNKEFSNRRIKKFILYSLAIIIFAYISALRGVSNGLAKGGK